MKIGWQHINDPGLLQTGDIGHLRGRSAIIGPGIRLFSTHTGESPTFANHTFHVHTPAVYNLRNELRMPVEIIEAEADGVNVNPLSHYANQADIVITRVRPLTAVEKNAIQLAGLEYHRSRYPYAKIVLHALQRILAPAGDDIRRLSFLRNPYCNMLTQLCYQRIGVSFGRSPDISTPDDLMDWTMRYAHEIVWVSGPKALSYLSEAYPNVRNYS